MSHRIISAVVGLVLLLGSTPCLAERPEHEGKLLLFGSLHAHSKLSDDVSAAGDEMRPLSLFQSAHANGLDFLAITDHHKAVDSNHRLWMTTSEYRTELYDVAMAYNGQYQGQFIAIPGIEWGNTAIGNHLNVFGARDLPPDSIRDADYDKLIRWALANADFVQFNHPYSWAAKSNRNREVGNFGQMLYADSADFVKAVDPAVKTISIICSVHGGHISGRHRLSEQKTHREVHRSAFRHYNAYLNMGFHLSPAANQDTHSPNCGTVTAARTAVWADSASYPDLISAMRAHRVYATEDDEMAVVFCVESAGELYWMGETVPLDSDEADVFVIAKVWQALGSDGDLVDEGPYTLTIYSDADGMAAGRRPPGPRTIFPAGRKCAFPCTSPPASTSILRSPSRGERTTPSEMARTRLTTKPASTSPTASATT